MPYRYQKSLNDNEEGTKWPRSCTGPRDFSGATAVQAYDPHVALSGRLTEAGLRKDVRFLKCNIFGVAFAL